MSSTAAITMSDTSAPPNLLTRLLRLVGYVTDPQTLPGKAFTRWEQAVTGIMGKLATNDRYLRFAGRGLEASFRARKNAIDVAEEMLHFARLPSVSEVNELRNQVRVLGDRLEVTTGQLELALGLLERIDARIEAEGQAAPATPSAAADTKGGAS